MSHADEQRGRRGGASTPSRPSNGNSGSGVSLRRALRGARARPGSPHPLGAHCRTGPDGVPGTNFALWAGGADAVEVCLFDTEDGSGAGDGSEAESTKSRKTPEAPEGAEAQKNRKAAKDVSDTAGTTGTADTANTVDTAEREERYLLPEFTGGVWHGFLPGVGPGQRYGFRVYGPWDPWRGERWNSAKLLLDPYARAVDGVWTPPAGEHDGLPSEMYGHVRDWPRQDIADTVLDNRDSSPFVPKGVVVGPAADAPSAAGSASRRGGVERPTDLGPRPGTPWSQTVIYELHVRGFTMLHPEIPQRLRGTYAGLAHPAAIEHLTGLGVTAVELLPVHQFAHEEHLLRRGLRNYWGYNSIGYFAPHAAYSSSGTSGQQVEEFRAMVSALHHAGIEVLLDVVYNHTAEAGERGPTLSLRGIDNRAYYRLQPELRQYADFTGCGNTLHAVQPPALRLIMDSLRYWVREMGVDGFRFDLASALARTPHGVDAHAPLLSAIGQDPVLRGVKLIAEPWDVGQDGYWAGGFPSPWSEWNDRFRDTVRDFWRGALPDPRELGSRLAGSSDLYGRGGRRPYASVNLVTAHDGFTLRDLVSYEQKRNEANGESGQDGSSDNRSWNCGAEGATDDERVLALRRRQLRNMLSTLLLSTGVPMLLAGDEMGRTQHGNNNAYCQDNETSWVDWSLLREPGWRELYTLTARLVRLRRTHPVLRSRTFFDGRAHGSAGLRDLAWFAPCGREMTEEDWRAPGATLGMFLSGRDIAQRDEHGERVVGDSFLCVLHAGAEPTSFPLPGAPWATGYELVLDTSLEEQSQPPRSLHHTGEPLALPGRSLRLLRALREDEPGGDRRQLQPEHPV